MDKEKKRRADALGAEPPSAHAVNGEPVDVADLVNKYGTYEVQDTTDTDNVFPLIGPMGAGTTGVVLPDIPDALDDVGEPMESKQAAKEKRDTAP